MDGSRPGKTVVTDLAGDRWLVSLEGEHDVSTAEDLRTKLRAIFRTGTTVVIDLSETTFLDSSTLRVLIEADRYAHEQACERVGVVVDKGGGPAERLFALVGAHRVFDVFGSAEEAFAALGAAPHSADADLAARRWQRKQRIVKNEQAFRDYNDRRLQHEPVSCRLCGGEAARGWPVESRAR
jgi:anti-anti-sigma factor